MASAIIDCSMTLGRCQYVIIACLGVSQFVHPYRGTDEGRPGTGGHTHFVTARVLPFDLTRASLLRESWLPISHVQYELDAMPARHIRGTKPYVVDIGQAQ